MNFLKNIINKKIILNKKNITLYILTVFVGVVSGKFSMFFIGGYIVGILWTYMSIYWQE